MSSALEIPPKRSSDLVLSPKEQDGQQVVKNNRKKTYLRIGPHESFLLHQLDGRQSYGGIIAAFRQEFGEDVSIEEIQQFVELADREGLLGSRQSNSSDQQLTLVGLLRRITRAMGRQSPLYFRVKLFDPDKALNWLEPRTRILFSVWMAVFVLVGGVAAFACTWIFRGELVETVTSQFGVRAVIAFWLTTIVVTVLHEYGHGLACKRFGGSVHEMGALWIFFTPCLYCNVSDAWMVPGRWRRLLISIAGTYVDLLIYILAVVAWRIAAPESMIHFVSWIVISSCGVRLAFNSNPLMRLDGYYALSDLLRQPNLRIRSRDRMMEFVRSLCWGAPWPKPVPDSGILLTYGIASWLFAVGLLGLLSFQLSAWLGQFVGVGGIVLAASFFFMITRNLNKGLLGGEFRQMFSKRLFRILVVAGLLSAAMFIPVNDRSGGDFTIKPLRHWDVCSPIGGFLREVFTAEGKQTTAGSHIATIEIPELSNQISRKQAEIEEVQAELKRLTTGARIEELTEQRARITRSTAWRDLGAEGLRKARIAFQMELETLDFRINQARTENDYRRATLELALQLHKKGGLAEQQLLAQKRMSLESAAQLQVAESVRKTREAEGVTAVEMELARREKELADEQSKLTLLLAGSRSEDIEAEQARLSRLGEEMRILREQESMQKIFCPASGTVITPRLKDKIGQYFDRGAALLVVEDLDHLEADIVVPEQQAQLVNAGQEIALKSRLLPHYTLKGTVLRVAPAVQYAVPGAPPTVVVHCRVDDPGKLLRSGMTGYGRIQLGRVPLGVWFYGRAVRMLRTEFWW